MGSFKGSSDTVPFLSMQSLHHLSPCDNWGVALCFLCAPHKCCLTTGLESGSALRWAHHQRIRFCSLATAQRWLQCETSKLKTLSANCCLSLILKEAEICYTWQLAQGPGSVSDPGRSLPVPTWALPRQRQQQREGFVVAIVCPLLFAVSQPVTCCRVYAQVCLFLLKHYYLTAEVGKCLENRRGHLSAGEVLLPRCAKAPEEPAFGRGHPSQGQDCIHYRREM